MLDHIKVSKLQNGMVLATVPREQAQGASIGFWVRVGGRYESAKTAGASHFIEHLLFKGTPQRSAKTISQTIEGRGGFINAYTQEEVTCFYARVPHEYQREAFEILADMYLNAKLAPGDVDRERGVIIEELRMFRDQPQAIVQEQLSEALWSGHPIGLPLTGNERSVGAMSRDELDTFRRERYQPRRTVVVFGGHVKHDDCLQWMEQQFSAAGNGRAIRFRPVTAKTPQERIRVVRRDVEQMHVELGFRTPFDRHDSRRYALRVLNALLGENMSSRLFQSVREKHGLAYSINSNFQLFDDTGVFSIGAGCDVSKAPKMLRLLAAEMDKLRNRPVGPAELRRTKDYVLGSFRLGFEGTGTQMSWVGESLALYHGVHDPHEFVRQVQTISAAQVQAVAATVFDPQRLSVSLITPQTHSFTEEQWLATLAVL